MNTNVTSSTSEIRAEQVPSTKYEVIYLGVDLHKESITVTRIIDHATPQPAQRFTWDSFWRFVQKQVALAKKVYVVYESGAFGFWVCRQLKVLKVECFVVHPEKLDPRHKRVQTDKLDSRYLAEKLQRYVLGNTQAMVAVYVPTVEEEQQRIESRHRHSLSKQLHSLRARGRGLLLSQGIFATQGWWRQDNWQELRPKLCRQLIQVLEDNRQLILDLEKRLKTVEKKLEEAAPKELPQGFGRLTFVLLLRQICNYQRFHKRRNLGGFTGLGGAVSSSGPYHLDLSINKAGDPYVRSLLIELAWRMVYWQPNYRGLKRWKRLRDSGGLGHKSQRKKAVVALARQLAVDIWRWQTGRVSPEQLGWKMILS